MKVFRLLAITAAALALATMAVANPITPGQVLVNFQGTGQGTASGFFTITTSGGTPTLSAADFQVSQTTNCCSPTQGFPSFEYTLGNSTGSIFTFANGDQEIGLNADPHIFAGGGASTLVIHFDCGGVASCLTNNLANNNSFQVTFSEVGEPDGSPFRTTGTVFMHITDDPGVFSLNLDPTLLAGTTLIGGSGNTGGGTPAPEPGSLLMLGSGLLGAPLARRLKLRK